jgi:DNA-binding HxlR family transcriptional regulator
MLLEISTTQPVAEKKKAKVFTRTKNPLPITLTKRDVLALEELAKHRCLTGEQLRRLVFRCGPSMLRRRLRALYDHGFIDRVRIAVVPTPKMPPFVYSISHKGAELLPELAARFHPEIISEVRSIAGLQGAGLKFVAHRLIVNETHVVLEEAARRHGYSIEWRHEEALNVGGAEKGRRAEVIRHPMLKEPATFLPDGYFELMLPNGNSYAFFVEIDMANHPQSVWRHRAKLYTAYADPRTGLFRRRFKRETFRLLVVTTPDYRKRSRLSNILHTIQQTVGKSDMFLGTTFDSLSTDILIGKCWQSADGTNHPISLVNKSCIVVSAKPSAPVIVHPAIQVSCMKK